MYTVSSSRTCPGKVHIYYSKKTLKICVFSTVLKTLIVALALILFGSVFQALAAETVNDRAPCKFFGLFSVNSSLFAERIFHRSGSYSLTRLHK